MKGKIKVERIILTKKPDSSKVYVDFPYKGDVRKEDLCVIGRLWEDGKDEERFVLSKQEIEELYRIIQPRLIEHR